MTKLQVFKLNSRVVGYTPLRFWVLKSLSSKESAEKLLLSSSLSSFSDSVLDSWLLILCRSGQKLLATVFLTAPRAPDLYVRFLSSGAISRRPFFAMGQKGAQFLRFQWISMLSIFSGFIRARTFIKRKTPTKLGHQGFGAHVPELWCPFEMAYRFFVSTNMGFRNRSLSFFHIYLGILDFSCS